MIRIELQPGLRSGVCCNRLFAGLSGLSFLNPSTIFEAGVEDRISKAVDAGAIEAILDEWALASNRKDFA